MQHILKEAKRANPSTEQLSKHDSEQQDRTECDEWEEMVSGIMDIHSDGTGEPGENTGMAAENRVAEPFELRPPGTVQEKKGKGLRYSSLDHNR
jgi:hypothetical protein